MISAVSNKGEMQFMVFDGAMNVDIFKDFMTRFVKDSPCRVFLIVDNLRVHHAKILDTWLEENSQKIKLFYLPSYSPELNPDEYLNRDVKASLAEKKRPRTAKALKADVVAHLSASQHRWRGLDRPSTTVVLCNCPPRSAGAIILIVVHRQGCRQRSRQQVRQQVVRSST